MFSIQGLIYIINSFVFTLCALTIAFLVGSIINNKNAMNGQLELEEAAGEAAEDKPSVIDLQKQRQSATV